MKYNILLLNGNLWRTIPLKRGRNEEKEENKKLKKDATSLEAPSLETARHHVMFLRTQRDADISQQCTERAWCARATEHGLPAGWWGHLHGCVFHGAACLHSTGDAVCLKGP